MENDSLFPQECMCFFCSLSLEMLEVVGENWFSDSTDLELFPCQDSEQVGAKPPAREPVGEAVFCSEAFY